MIAHVPAYLKINVKEKLPPCAIKFSNFKNTNCMVYVS